ncbi:MAG: TSUP family transporter, partial [Candidatus Saccharimonadales bacterium]
MIAILLGIFTFVNILAPVSGSATVTPVLTGLVGAKDAVAVATVFFFLTCIPRIYLFRKYIRWPIVKQLWPISIIGALCGGLIFTGVPEQIIAIIIFCFLAWFLYQKA